MKLVTYQSESGPRAAASVAGGYVDLANADPALPETMVELIAGGSALMARAAAAATQAKPMSAAGVRLLPPIPAPRKIICIGLNYADHAAETERPPPEPICFNKFPTAAAAHEDTIILPPQSSEVDYEAELVVVIGRGGKNISRSNARQHIAGYTCGNDVSARDWQKHKPGGQWLLGKSFDGFAPFGPALVTADEVPEPGNLRVQLRLNGNTMQDSTTRQLIFPIDVLVEYLSQVCTFQTGDVIFTGTPPGVGMARKPPVWIEPGDVVEVEVEGLGVLRNRFAAP